jgi:geranylgeranyl reductase family protein
VDLYDVIVIGAGPGGAATATFLARNGLHVLLLDKFEFPRDKTCGDALSPAALHVLADLGLADDLRQSGYRVDGVSITSPEGLTVQAPIPEHPVYPKHGYVVPRYLLDDLILNASVHSGAEFQGGIHVHSIEQTAEGPIVIGEAGRTPRRLGARVVVLAVGANLRLLRSIGIVSGNVGFAHAVRAYFEGIAGLSRQLEIRFDGTKLPGYGWIFPVSADTANVGAGLLPRRGRKAPGSATMLSQFLSNGHLHKRFQSARQVGPVKGFPIRTDFQRSPVVGDRLLLVGEAAGLVNPFTGEGIDYALESARIASECLMACIERGDLSRLALGDYECALRHRFQRDFVLSHRMRRQYMNPILLDPLIRACARWPELTDLLVRTLLTYADPAEAIRPAVMLKVLRCLPSNHPSGLSAPS